ncbi:hypothetical protein NKG05_00090 [Oerskovia sp. M15]
MDVGGQQQPGGRHAAQQPRAARQRRRHGWVPDGGAPWRGGCGEGIGRGHGVLRVLGCGWAGKPGGNAARSRAALGPMLQLKDFSTPDARRRVTMRTSTSQQTPDRPVASRAVAARAAADGTCAPTDPARRPATCSPDVRCSSRRAPGGCPGPRRVLGRRRRAGTAGTGGEGSGTGDGGSADAPPSGTSLAKTADVPVGGALSVEADGATYLVTQPEEGPSKPSVRSAPTRAASSRPGTASWPARATGRGST